MTAAFLQVELSNLISDSKRKNAEIKTAAEKSLSELKGISITSETQLSGDLSRRSHFIDPFVLACKSQNAKLASTGTAGLQRCVAATAVPRSRISDVLQAYEEASPLALDVQLKILQTLPSLLQLYADDLHGRDVLGRALTISSDLSANKLPMVSKTASATFQQLVTTVFARIPLSRSSGRGNEDAPNLARDREDAFAVFVDLCALLVGENAAFARLDNLPPPTVLEVLEALMSSHGSQLLRDPEATKACSEYLLPGICNLVDSSSNYGVVVRATRIAYIFAISYTSKVTKGLNSFLKILLKFADRPPSHRWKRLLSLEFFRGICADFDALRNIFTIFDLQQGRQNVVADFMASLVRTASEDPTLIGLGRQTTIPTTRTTDSGGEVAGAADVPLSAIAQTSATATGISLEWSSVTTPCLDVYDKLTPPETPETYVYTLVLGCVSSCSDGLSKFIMPLSMPSRKTSKIEEVEEVEGDPIEGDEIPRRPSLRDASSLQKHQQLINPLSQKNLVKKEAVENCAKMIENCWPAILAICSTFLNAALDSYYYHMLIRTVQKLTQVSGVLELNTPRDALLTTLAKVSLPANVTGLLNGLYGAKTALVSLRELQLQDEDDTMKSPVASTPRASMDLSSQSLNVRNLLCLRALLNLGIALGPTLSQAAWLIILQSLEQVEALMSAGPYAKLLQSTSATGDTPAVSQGNSLSAEISSLDTARRRMIESTSTYSDEAFTTVCQALLQIIAEVLPTPEPRKNSEANGNLTSRPIPTLHKSTRSVSGNWAKATTLEIEVEFVLKTLGRLASVNLHRFRDDESSEASWSLIVLNLMRLEMDDKILPGLRLQCAKIIDAIAVEASTSRDELDEVATEADSSIVVKYGIPSLGRQLEVIHRQSDTGVKINNPASKIVHMVLEALQNIVGSCGETLDDGWSGVFKIVQEVVDFLEGQEVSDVAASLYTQAFKVIQLTLSDFLSVLDDHSMETLLKLFDNFARQGTDLNMALTTSALYWNVASLLLNRAQNFELTTNSEVNGEGGVRSNFLWSQVIFGLHQLCKDNRPDVRNAALRMLSRILNASMSYVDSATLASCFDQVWLSLVSYYSGMIKDGGEDWNTSVFAILDDIQLATEHYGNVLLGHSDLRNLWRKNSRVLEELLKLQTLALTTTVFQTLANMLSSLRKLSASLEFNSDDEAVRELWSVWVNNHPSDIQAVASNESALSAHAMLMIEIASWRFDYLCSSDDFANGIAKAISRSVFSARHDQYTADVKRLSPSQKKLIQLLEVLQKLLTHRDRSIQDMLVKLVDDVIATTDENTQQPAPTSRNPKIPTNIAFATACIEILRQDLLIKAESDRFCDIVPVPSVLKLCTGLIKTKYGSLPVNPEQPLWQKSCLLGVECIGAVRKHVLGISPNTSTDTNELAGRIIDLSEAILRAPHLNETQSESDPQRLERDEQFDMTQFRALHTPAIDIFRELSVSENQLQRYILLVFKQSLVAQPWYNDLTTDLDNHPLADFATIRRGSIRFPILPIRRRIYEEALRSLFDIVDQRHQATAGSNPPAIATISFLAAPYILLRLAHTLKTFIADQPLRYLEQPKPALQHELYVVISAFVKLRVADGAFEQTAKDLGCGVSLEKENGDEATVRDVSQVIRRDGKSHLRLMFPLMQKVEQVWYEIPRLDIRECSWQASEDGRGVERCLKEWKEQVSAGWGPKFT